MTRASAGPAGSAGVLTVAVAPAGDAADASARLGPALASAGLIAAADPGRLRKLAAELGVRLTGRVVPYADDQTDRRVAGQSAAAGAAPGPDALAPAELRPAAGPLPAAGLLAELQAGRDVLLVTDAGARRGRGYAGRVVAAASDAGIRVTVLPGASAITTALVVSGLPADRFVVEGFLPLESGERDRRVAELAAERRTLVFIDSPSRIGATLAGLAAAFGADRQAVACPGPSTTDADVLRGTLGELAGRLADGGTAGEVTVVVAGAAAPATTLALPDAVVLVRARVLAGATTKDAVAAVAAATGLRRRDLYNAAAGDSTAAPEGHSA